MERHPFRLGYLVTGVLFILVAIVGLAELRLERAVDLAWIGPGLLVLLGVALVVGTAIGRGGRDEVDEAPDEARDEALDTEVPSA
jgi:hypothetical protein